MPKNWKNKGKSEEQAPIISIDRDEAKRIPGASVKSEKGRRKPISVYLNDRELEAVTTEAERRGESVSAFIRQTLQRRLRLN